MKRLLIDVNSVVPYFVNGTVNGIGRTTRELVLALDSMEDLPFEVTLYAQNMKGIGGANLGTGFQSKHLYLPYREKWNHIVSQLSLRELLCRYDLMHIPHNYIETRHADRCICTMHDAMFFAFPEDTFHPEFCRKYYTDFARRCRAVITCSEASKSDIVNYMHIPEERVFVTPWGVDHNLFHPTAKSDRPYFISTSCDLGRKNSLTLIRAFARYKSKNGSHSLILVWRNPPKIIRDEISSLGLEDCIHFAHNISDIALAELYASATACFFPSLYEGFGLPVLESMACGTPVVTCHNSSLPEVGGEAALYTNPNDEDAMAELMRQFEWMSKSDYETLCKLSIDQSSLFTWKRCAIQTIDVYKRCL